MTTTTARPLARTRRVAAAALVAVAASLLLPAAPGDAAVPASLRAVATAAPSTQGDTAEEAADGAAYLTSTDLELVVDGARGAQAVGVRFPRLAVPQGAEIVRAHVTFTADEVSTGPASLVVAGLAADDAAPFTWQAGELGERPRTAASVAWAPPAWTAVGQRGAATRTADLAAVVAEVVGRPGWREGNALGLVVTGTGTRTAAALADGAAAAPTLRVVFRPRAVPEDVRLAVFGDYGIGCCDEARVASLVESLAPDAIVTTGDNRYRPEVDRAIGQFYADWISDYGGAYGAGSVRNRFFPAIGNHDYDPPGGLAAHLSYVDLPGDGVLSTRTSGTERYYDVLLGPVHVFVLNADKREPDGRTADSKQATWLRQQLAASPAPWQAVVLHESPFSSGTEHGSTPIMQWPFAAWGADVVLSGNDHDYERVERDGIPYLVTGAGGRSLYPFGPFVEGSAFGYDDDYGTVLLEGCESGLRLTFHSVSEGVVDTRAVGDPCEVTRPPVEGRFRTVVAHPRGSADDAEESEAGWVDTSSSDLELVREPWGGQQLVGIRFPAVDVPRGAEVVDATLSFHVDEVDDGSPSSLVVRAEAADDAAWFDAARHDLSTRPTTGAAVGWQPPSWTTVGASGPAQRGPYLVDVVQEVLDRPGWTRGNALVLLLSGEGTRVAEAWEGGAATAPRLEITYRR